MVASITLTPNSGNVGDSILITGAEFNVGDTMSFTYDGAPIVPTEAPIVVAGDGTLPTCHIVIPASVKGIHAVVATDESLNTDSENFTVAQTTTLSSGSGNVGSTSIITGTGFATLSLMAFTFGGNPIVPTGAPITTDADGGFTATITIPASIKGNHNVVSTDAGTNVATSVFATTQHISISPSTQRIGGSITITATGFAGASLCAITIGGTTVTPATTDSTGGFIQAETIPTLASGTRSVSVTDASTNNDATNMTVSAVTLARSVTHGPKGTATVLTGANYIPSHDLTITNIDSTTSHVTADSSGNIPASTILITGPNVQGSHNITVSDGTNTGTVTFTTDPSIAISPTTANVGDTISITGEGFASSSAVSTTLAGSGVTTSPSSPSPSSAGHFTATFVVPAIVQGNATVSCTDAVPNNATAVLLIEPKIVIDPITGSAGQLVQIIGTGYATLSAVTLQLDGVAISPTSAITTDSTGGFTNSVTIPYATALGAHIITATDAAANVYTATYTVNEANIIPITLLNSSKPYLPNGIIDEQRAIGGAATYSNIGIFPFYNFTDLQLQMYNEHASNVITYEIYGHMDYNEGNEPDPTLASWKLISSADVDITGHTSALITLTKPALWSWIMIQAKPKVANDDAILDIWGRMVKAVSQ